MKLTRDLANLFILMMVVVVSLAFSMTADLAGAELGALTNLILPPALGGICVIVYLSGVYLFRLPARGLSIACSIAIILLGIKLHYTH